MLAGCAADAPNARVKYSLSSPDVGQAWHLHARDGTLLCELPCEEWIGAHSGSYLVVHEPRVWRVNVPSALPAPAGSSVVMEAHVGKGSPTLGAVGTTLGMTGAAIAFAGIVLGVADFIGFFSCGDALETPGSSSSSSCPAATSFAIGGALLAAGAILGGIGFYWMEHNTSASAHIVVTPTSIAGRF
jgi:hypothetical protein